MTQTGSAGTVGITPARSHLHVRRALAIAAYDGLDWSQSTPSQASRLGDAQMGGAFSLPGATA